MMSCITCKGTHILIRRHLKGHGVHLRATTDRSTTRIVQAEPEIDVSDCVNEPSMSKGLRLGTIGRLPSRVNRAIRQPVVELRVPSTLCLIAKVADPKVPGHGLVLCGLRAPKLIQPQHDALFWHEIGAVVHDWYLLQKLRAMVPTCFEEEDGVALASESGPEIGVVRLLSLTKAGLVCLTLHCRLQRLSRPRHIHNFRLRMLAEVWQRL